MGNRSRADIRRSIHARIRKKVRGSAERPRLSVFRSGNHIYAQVIDDVSGTTLASASSVEKKLKVKSGSNIDGAAIVGKAIAERTLGAGIETVVFDRGGYIYHGRVKALLDASREAGLNKDEAKGSDEKKETAAKSKKPAAKKKSESTKTAKDKGKSAGSSSKPKEDSKAKKDDQ